jgi:hypothetical protein
MGFFSIRADKNALDIPTKKLEMFSEVAKKLRK